MTGCNQTDVIRKYSEKSLNEITANYSSIITNEDTQFKLSVDNENTLIIKKDFASKEDIIMMLNITPFIDAGLDINKLPNGYRIENGSLIISTDFKDGKSTTFNEAIFVAVDNNRKKLSYHKDLDHYGLTLLNDNKFEFAKNYKTNDKDIVFILNTIPLIDSGVDVKNIDGWVYKTIKQSDGAKINVIVKPYNLD